MKNRRSRGFTLIELLVVIAIIAILAAILFPVFAQARESARKSSCLSNLKQIGMAFAQYTTDYDGQLPQADWGIAIGVNGWPASASPNIQERDAWPAHIMPYIKNRAVFDCPTSADKIFNQTINTIDGNYIYNEEAADDAGNMLDNLGRGVPAGVALVLDGGDDAITQIASLERMLIDDFDSRSLADRGNRHQETANVVFGDGHAKALNKGQLLSGWRDFEPPWGVNWTSQTAPNAANVFP